MDGIAKRSKITMGGAKRINQKLERELLVQTKVMNKNLELIEKERLGIVTTRKNINEELTTLQNSPDFSRFRKLTINSKEEKRASFSLSQSKFLLNAAIEKAKNYTFLSPSIGYNDCFSKETDENCNRRTTLPFLTIPTSCSITETALENREEIDSSEKVRRYIRMQNTELNNNRIDSNSGFSEDDKERTLSSNMSCPEFSARLKENDVSGSRSTFKNDNQGRPREQKIRNRRHSVLGVTLNVPIVVSESGSGIPSSRARLDSRGSSVDGDDSSKMSNKELSIDDAFRGNNSRSGTSYISPAWNRRRSLPSSSPFPPATTKSKLERTKCSRRSSLPYIESTSPTLLCTQNMYDIQETNAIPEESVDEGDLSEESASTDINI